MHRQRVIWHRKLIFVSEIRLTGDWKVWFHLGQEIKVNPTSHLIMFGAGLCIGAWFFIVIYGRNSNNLLNTLVGHDISWWSSKIDTQGLSLSVQVISKCRRRRSRQRFKKIPSNTSLRPIQESICSRSFPVYLRNNYRTDWKAHQIVKMNDSTNRFHLNEYGTLYPDTLDHRPVSRAWSVDRIRRNVVSK